MYFGAGLLAGGVGGILKPLGKSLPGAMLIGIIAAIVPSYLVSSMVSEPDWPPFVVRTGAAITAVVFGAGFGHAFWSLAREDEQKRAKYEAGPQ